MLRFSIPDLFGKGRTGVYEPLLLTDCAILGVYCSISPQNDFNNVTIQTQMTPLT